MNPTGVGRDDKLSDEKLSATERQTLADCGHVLVTELDQAILDLSSDGCVSIDRAETAHEVARSLMVLLDTDDMTQSFWYERIDARHERLRQLLRRSR